jgi:hypothetical protein
VDVRRRLAAIEEQAGRPASKVDLTLLSDDTLKRLAGIYDAVTADGRELTADEMNAALQAIAAGGRR